MMFGEGAQSRISTLKRDGCTRESVCKTKRSCVICSLRLVLSLSLNQGCSAAGLVGRKKELRSKCFSYQETSVPSELLCCYVLMIG